MNYIKMLEEENKALRARLEVPRTKIIALEGYLTSPKFHCGDDLDGYVNTQDVVDVLRDIRTELL